MRSIPRHDVPVAIADGGVEVRVLDQDGLMVGFVRLLAGADLRPATKGLDLDHEPTDGGGVRRRTANRRRRRGPEGDATRWRCARGPSA